MNAGIASAKKKAVTSKGKGKGKGSNEIVESKFDQVIIDYETHNLSKDRINWERMCVEDQRELLARGAVRFFKDEEEVPFYRALL